MNLLRMTRKMFMVPLLVLLALLAAGPVFAGGWAVITLDQLPGELHAGETLHLGFMVRQHGKTPIHYLGGPDSPIKPVVTGTNVETGEFVQFTAVRDESEVGHFYVDIVFPSEGEWNWTIAPNPLAGKTNLSPLTVLLPLKGLPADPGTTTTTAASVAPATGGPDLAMILRGAAVLLMAGGVLTVVLAGRRDKRLETAVVESGD
ncbi:MAG: hypothetical protein WAM60_25790 [Candidatus Promineifilaceae bacterium]